MYVHGEISSQVDGNQIIKSEEEEEGDDDKTSTNQAIHVHPAQPSLIQCKLHQCYKSTGSRNTCTSK
jgi:hypothetical protein